MQSDIAFLAINEFRRDWPFMASLLDDLRAKAATGGPACGGAVSAARVPKGLTPPLGNHGDNNFNQRAVSK